MPAGTAYCIPQGMLGSTIENVDVDNDGVVDHFRFEIRNQFLHPEHPLGWIRSLTISLDGTELQREAIGFVLRGQWIAVEKLPTISDIWWHMREIAEVYVRSSGLAAGRHRIDVDFNVSLFVHTPSIDRHGRWPTLRQHLTTEMELAS